MEPDTILEVERQFDVPRSVLFRAFTEPKALAQWFAPDGWHVVPESVELDPKLGGRLRHTKTRDDDPSRIWVVDGLYTEVFYPDVLVTKQRISGIPESIPPNPLSFASNSLASAMARRFYASCRAPTLPKPLRTIPTAGSPFSIICRNISTPLRASPHRTRSHERKDDNPHSA